MVYGDYVALVRCRMEPAETDPAPDRAEVRDLQADLPLDEAAAERTAERIVRATVPRDERRRRAESRALTAIRRLLRALPGSDPKIEALLAELRRVIADPTDKVIVFTEYRDTLEAIQTALEASPDLSGRSVILRGGMPPRQRRCSRPSRRLPTSSLAFSSTVLILTRRPPS